MKKRYQVAQILRDGKVDFRCIHMKNSDQLLGKYNTHYHLEPSVFDTLEEAEIAIASMDILCHPTTILTIYSSN
jgi:hypothetical protein